MDGPTSRTRGICPLAGPDIASNTAKPETHMSPCFAAIQARRSSRLASTFAKQPSSTQPITRSVPSAPTREPDLDADMRAAGGRWQLPPGLRRHPALRQALSGDVGARLAGLAL